MRLTKTGCQVPVTCLHSQLLPISFQFYPFMGKKQGDLLNNNSNRINIMPFLKMASLQFTPKW